MLVFGGVKLKTLLMITSIWTARYMSDKEWRQNCLKAWPKSSHTIHGTGIFTFIWLIFMGNVGKHTSPMDGMGIIKLSVPMESIGISCGKPASFGALWICFH